MSPLWLAAWPLPGRARSSFPRLWLARRRGGERVEGAGRVGRRAAWNARARAFRLNSERVSLHRRCERAVCTSICVWMCAHTRVVLWRGAWRAHRAHARAGAERDEPLSRVTFILWETVHTFSLCLTHAGPPQISRDSRRPAGPTKEHTATRAGAFSFYQVNAHRPQVIVTHRRPTMCPTCAHATAQLSRTPRSLCVVFVGSCPSRVTSSNECPSIPLREEA